MGKLTGRTAIVTGAARGIGKAIAQRLAEAGASVAVADVLAERDETAAEIVAQGGRAIAVDTDVSQDEAVRDLVARTLDEFGQIDILASNAAVEFRGPFEEVKDDEWTRLYDVNVKGLYHCCKHVLPHMKARRSGAIIAIGSATSVRGFENFVAYSGTKGAVLQIVRSLALEVRRDGIRVNCVCPGLTDTVMGRAAMEATHGENTEQVIEDIQMRWGVPDDIARAVVFLASDEADFIVGQSVSVDGGLTT